MPVRIQVTIEDTQPGDPVFPFELVLLAVDGIVPAPASSYDVTLHFGDASIVPGDAVSPTPADRVSSRDGGRDDGGKNFQEIKWASLTLGSDHTARIPFRRRDAGARRVPVFAVAKSRAPIAGDPAGTQYVYHQVLSIP